ncbi:MAG: DUF3307 domain-containing protein [Bdellovibrionota bacterium]
MADFTQLELAFALSVIFQFKHFIADYPLQFPYMLRKFRPGWDFLLPLATHCFVHAFLTLIIVLVFAPELWWLAVLDFVVHFVMDRIKSGPRYLGRFSNSAKSGYWIAFGFDQMVHHLTHIYIVWVIVTRHH